MTSWQASASDGCRAAGGLHLDAERAAGSPRHGGHLRRERSAAEQPRAVPSAGDASPGDPHRARVVPSVTLVAVLLGGWHAQVETASCYLHPTEKFLTLEVQTDKADYRPGERCTAIVTATDYRGRIVPGPTSAWAWSMRRSTRSTPTRCPTCSGCSTSIALPDCCVGEFEEQGPPAEPLQFLLGPRYAWGYYCPTLLDWGSGRRSARLGCYGGCCGCCAAAGIEARRSAAASRAAAHWVADLVTDAEGKARTTFDFPDNVAAWRFTARGVTADTRVGDLRVHAPHAAAAGGGPGRCRGIARGRSDRPARGAPQQQRRGPHGPGHDPRWARRPSGPGPSSPCRPTATCA